MYRRLHNKGLKACKFPFAPPNHLIAIRQPHQSLPLGLHLERALVQVRSVSDLDGQAVRQRVAGAAGAEPGEGAAAELAARRGELVVAPAVFVIYSFQVCVKGLIKMTVEEATLGVTEGEGREPCLALRENEGVGKEPADPIFQHESMIDSHLDTYTMFLSMSFLTTYQGPPGRRMP